MFKTLHGDLPAFSSSAAGDEMGQIGQGARLPVSLRFAEATRDTVSYIVRSAANGNEIVFFLSSGSWLDAPE